MKKLILKLYAVLSVFFFMKILTLTSTSYDEHKKELQLNAPGVLVTYSDGFNNRVLGLEHESEWSMKLLI